MFSRTKKRRLASVAVVASLLATGLVAGPPAAAASQAEPEVQGPIPAAPPGDPRAPELADTYPWMATDADLAARGYVEREYYVSGVADAFDRTGRRLAEDVPYKTRVIVRAPADPRRFSGIAMAEWQNVSAGFDLDALWSTEQFTRAGHAWVGISAQRVGVNQLRGWSPVRYGTLDVTGGGRFADDELSYDIFAQAASTLRGPGGPLGRHKVRTLLGVGASQSAGRMTVYYDAVLPQTQKVFDAYGFIVGSAPARRGPEPVFQVLSETDVRSPNRPPDGATFRRWEVAGTAHSGFHGQQYRAPILERDLGQAPSYDCDSPPFSRVPLHHPIAAAYEHLVRWVQRGTPPPSAPPLEFNADGTLARDALGLARGGIRLSQVEAPTALNTGQNTGESFCVLFGTHQPFTPDRLRALYPSKGRFVQGVTSADRSALRAGHLLPADAAQNLRDAIAFPIPNPG